MDKNEWIYRILHSSVPLRQLNKERLPVGIASGCLVDYLGKRILLTVSHATGNQENWAIELCYEKNMDTKVYPLGAMHFLKKFSLDDLDAKDIDFSYVEVPRDLVPYRQDVHLSGDIMNQAQIEVFKPDFMSEPNEKERYGFSGTVMPSIEKHPSQTYFNTELKVFHNLTYRGKQEDYYIFELPIQHPGHEHFRGCSGAPIIDTQGNVVALVCNGCQKTNRIYGISLRQYKIALDITFGD
jgi:hypothetical protein